MEDSHIYFWNDETNKKDVSEDVSEQEQTSSDNKHNSY